MAKPLPMINPSHPGGSSHDEAPQPVRSTQPTSQESQAEQPDEEHRATRRAIRENARRILRESGVADILRRLNAQALQGRGWFEEYDSGVIFKWGSAVTRRHIWVDVDGEMLRFRLNPHIRCSAAVPACDGEYHSFTAATWSLPGAVLREVDRNYKRPVAESSAD